MPLKMPDSYDPCLTRFSFGARRDELDALGEAAERKRMTKAALIRSKFPEIFSPALPGRKWPSDPAQRHRRGASAT
jgi:hypothetical protein